MILRATFLSSGPTDHMLPSNPVHNFFVIPFTKDALTHKVHSVIHVAQTAVRLFPFRRDWTDINLL